MPTRVLILSWEYPPIVEGGLARHVRKLAEGLVRIGVEVHVLARGGGHLAAIEDRHGVTVHRVREPEFPKDDLDAFVHWVDAMNDDMRSAGIDRAVFLQKVYFPILKYLCITRHELLHAGRKLRGPHEAEGSPVILAHTNGAHEATPRAL